MLTLLGALKVKSVPSRGACCQSRCCQARSERLAVELGRSFMLGVAIIVAPQLQLIARL